MPDELRLFIALELPQDVLATLADVQARLREDGAGRAVKWVRPAGIHLTLKFLGDVPTGQTDNIIRGIEAAVIGHGPLTLEATGLGCFPHAGRPRVVWVGLAGDIERLRALQSAVERALGPLGFPPEKRSFSPHLTLGRVRRDARAAETTTLGNLVTSTRLGSVATWQTSAVSLIRSELQPNGARYSCLFEAPLGG